MGKRKNSLKKKYKNGIISLIVFIFLCITGYFGTNYYNDSIINIADDRTQITSSSSIENSELIDFNNVKLNITFFYVGQADSTFI